ncbi:MAG: phospho-N-acetylmuramoyl-pentapeptide-transferase, partial [Verrucomicrobiota bacterium]
MLYYLHQWAVDIGFLNVFRYATFRAFGAALTSLFICWWMGPMTIRILTRLKLGQPLRGKEEVHKLADLHSAKKGTPTMGGLLILFAVLGSTLLWARLDQVVLWLALGGMLTLGLVGFADDYAKVSKKKSDGIPGRVKLAGQFIVALGVAIVLMMSPTFSESCQKVFVPFLKEPILTHIGWWIIPFFAIVVMGTSNAVNLTDGLDGLAAGCTVSVTMVFAIFSFLSGNAVLSQYLYIPHTPGAGELAVFCAAMAGAALGFLWYNCHPAQVFMGDTGSLAIGGGLGVVAICINQELLLVIAGGVFVM